MKIDIVKGIYANNGEYSDKYPVNLLPICQNSGVSNSFLRPLYGISQFTDTSAWGVDRGGINYNGVMFRALGQYLVKIDSIGTITKVGEITNDNKTVKFAYSFDRLAVVSNGGLYYYTGSVFSQVTDPDLGRVTDIVWIDGYFALTDGRYIIVTELNDPASIDPFKYGSSEINPDDIKALLKLRNEIVALNRYSIEFFNDVGGAGFPFQRIEGATINRGCVGNDACCVYDDIITFLGGALDEEIAIYQGVNGQSVKISSKEIEKVINSYTETQLSATKLEIIMIDGELLLFVHFLYDTYIYNITASKLLQNSIWVRADSYPATSINYYDAWNFTRIHDKWYCGKRSGASIGELSREINNHWNNVIFWQFQTPILYNEGSGAIIHEIELQHIVKRLLISGDSLIRTNYSIDDGVTFSQDRLLNLGTEGARNKRIRWFGGGSFKNRRLQRFQGDSNAFVSFSRLDVKIEALTW